MAIHNYELSITSLCFKAQCGRCPKDPKLSKSLNVSNWVFKSCWNMFDLLSNFSLSLKTWSWLCFPPVTTRTKRRTRRTTPTKYLICNWPNFDQTLKVASWEHLEQMPTVMMTFVQATHVLTTFVYISNISAITDSILT